MGWYNTGNAVLGRRLENDARAYTNGISAAWDLWDSIPVTPPPAKKALNNEDLAKMLCHDIGEVLRRKYGRTWPVGATAISEYYALIRQTALEVLNHYNP